MSRRLSSEESDIWLNSAFEFVPTESNEPSMVDIDHSIVAYFTLNDIVSLVGKVISSIGVLCTVGGVVGEKYLRRQASCLFFATSEVISHLHRENSLPRLL